MLGYFRTKGGKESTLKHVDSKLERIKDGNLLVYNNGRTKKKWVTFDKQSTEGMTEETKYFLSIYPSKKEKKFQKKSYMFDNETFIGIEEGSVRPFDRYFTIFAIKCTIVFQTSDKDEASVWCEKFKENLKSERWTVQLKDSEESSNDMVSVLLHVTKSAVSITKFNPSELYKRWDVKKINCVSCEQGFINIGVTGAGVDSGFYQLKPQSHIHLEQIKKAIDKRRKTNETEMPKEIEESKSVQEMERQGLQLEKEVKSEDETNKNKKEEKADNIEPESGPITERFPDIVKDEDVEIPPPDIIRGVTEIPESKVVKNEDETNGDYLNQFVEYENDKTPRPKKDKPPPLPTRDDKRHFSSETLGETIAAIRKKKCCFRDSLRIPQKLRDDLYLKMDATGWWKELAAEIGLNVSDIDVIDKMAPGLYYSWTEIVIYHWECMPKPLRICNIREMENIARKTNRLDLLTMLCEA